MNYAVGMGLGCHDIRNKSREDSSWNSEAATEDTTHRHREVGDPYAYIYFSKIWHVG
jgi:hypothetical protein